jgi:hypothetical protein
MPYSTEPFLIEPLAIEPGWMETHPGHYRIYHGLGDSGNIDYTSPIALAAGDSPTASLVLPLAYGQRHFLAARAVSPVGVEEQNTHVVCCAEVDSSGRLLPPPLAAVSELTACLWPEGLISVGFSYRPPPGYAAAEQFEVLSNRGSGVLDLQTPLATIQAGVLAEYEAAVPADILPAMFAVRVCSQGRKGPVGLTVTVTSPQPEPVSILS